jgi:hypothetical protein
MPTQTDKTQVAEDGADDRPTVTAHESHADRTVFTERGNKEGWIATDLTIERWL